jgi:SPP1 gp7 family putative phage head morphogenesis protein
MWNVEPKPVQPEAAIRWFRSRLPLTDTSYRALEDTAKARGFTVSGLASLDLVQDVLRRLQTALEDGVPFEQWQKELPNGIKKAWGKDSGYRLKTIFDTNLQDAYGAGRYKAAIESKRPYLALEVVLDGNTSNICLKLIGFVRAANDPIWKKYRPPLHYRCRTALITLDQEEAEARGISTKPPTVQPLEGFGATPDLETGFPKAFTPDKTKYHPQLWAAYEKAVESRMQERIRVGRHANIIDSDLSSSETAQVLRVLNSAGLEGFLSENPLGGIRLTKDSVLAKDGILAQYDVKRKEIIINTARAESTWGNALTKDNTPGTISSTATTRLESLAGSLLHETGHHLIYQKIWATELETIVRTAAKEGVPMTRRAKKDWQEYFCETLSAYHYHPKILETRDPIGFAMIKQVRNVLRLP